MDRVTIKQQAKAVILNKRKPVLIASALFVALALLFAYLSFRLLMPTAEQLNMLSDRFYSLLLAGDYENAYNLAGSIQPSVGETIVSDLLNYLLAVVAFGFLTLLLNAVRGNEIVPGMLLDGFGSWAKVLLLEVATRLIVTFGFWLLIFPGVLALYNYRMARYLLVSHPDYGILDCMRESRLRMRGHRIELFLLDLSFVGWGILCMIPLLGIAVAVWALPYWKCSCVLFYEGLYAENPSPILPDNNEF